MKSSVAASISALFVITAVHHVEGFWPPWLPETPSPSWTDYRLVVAPRRVSAFAAQTRKGDPNCNGVGKQCDPTDCNKIIVCLNNTGELVSNPAGTCSDNMTCSGEGVCSTIPSPACLTAGISFQCTGEGMFPDQANCHKYYYCLQEGEDPTTFTPYPRDCPNDRGYNPRTGYCDKPLTNEKCVGYPIPLCTSPGFAGVVKENPSIYFVCLQNPTNSNILYPKLYLCPNGQTYSGNYGCK